MPNTIYATFLNQDTAERAAGALLDHGITSADISFIVPERMTSGPAHFSGASVPAGSDTSIPFTTPAPLNPGPLTAGRVETGATTVGLTRTTIAANAPMDVVQTDHDHIIDVNRDVPDAAGGLSTTTPADAVKGAAEGAGIGLGLGIALGLATVLIPGVGLVAGAGALVAGLAGATAAAGAVAGGAFGFLNDMGLPPHAIHRLEGSLKNGEPILSVHLNGSVSQGEIALLLEKYGATSAEVF